MIIKWIKILKYGKISLIRNLKNSSKKIVILNFKYVSKLEHKAIDILDPKDKNDFKFVNTNHSYNHRNMFISKSKKLIS